MGEKTLEDYFRESDPKYNLKKSKHKKDSQNDNPKKKVSSFKEFFLSKFSFDLDVDLTDPTSILYRRNYCIRNIIFLANLVFVLFSFVGISKSNYIITIGFFLLVTALSQTINYMLKRKKDDYSHQTILMYLQSFFVFLLSIILYIKVYLGFTIENGSMKSLTTFQFSITQAAYFLVYVTIVIMSLYQDTKLLRAMFIWTLVVMEIINICFIHPELYMHASNISELFEYAFIENGSIVLDIALRTLVFLVFFSALYSSASISHFIFEERRVEFNRRMGVETDFVDVVQSVFEAVRVYNLNQDPVHQEVSARKIASIARELALALGCDSITVSEVVEKAKVHTDKIKYLTLNGKANIDDSNFEEILNKTKVATQIIKRLQLSKRAEDIVYQVFIGSESKIFISQMSIDSKDLISNIILISEIYDILRSDRAYKKNLNHQRSVEMIMNSFNAFFDPEIIKRFVKFNNEIKIAYEIS